MNFEIIINKYTTMETIEKVNVRGAIKSLAIGDKLELSRSEYILSSVRNTATSVKSDTGKEFTVSSTDKMIIITRNQ